MPTIQTTLKDYYVEFERIQSIFGSSTSSGINKIRFFNNLNILIQEVYLSDIEVKFLLQQLYDLLELNTGLVYYIIKPKDTLGHKISLEVCDLIDEQSNHPGAGYLTFTLFDITTTTVKIYTYVEVDFLVSFIINLFEFIKTNSDASFYDPSFLL